jgi:hypothetical protein
MKEEQRPRVVVCGSRQFNDAKLLDRILHKLVLVLGEPIICTGAGYKYVKHPFDKCGADLLAEQWAYKHYLTVMLFHPDLEKHKSPAAFHIRNKEMIDFARQRRPCYFVAFHDGRSSGTASMIQLAKKYDFTRKVVRF